METEASQQSVDDEEEDEEQEEDGGDHTLLKVSSAAPLLGCDVTWVVSSCWESLLVKSCQSGPLATAQAA